ncbi:hypothetical protein AVEN_36401-1 [Araneus ventricosus]|uniref:Uncharacterized protein n=1 Tax=Araneus ventricosus TaxID=182803 RepID=A0A4Y2UZC3_ARAVE|nr:hypothetical protein AVEN_36401-1 [Araneus ventricosus]
MFAKQCEEGENCPLGNAYRAPPTFEPDDTDETNTTTESRTSTSKPRTRTTTESRTRATTESGTRTTIEPGTRTTTSPPLVIMSISKEGNWTTEIRGKMKDFLEKVKEWIKNISKSEKNE